MYVLESLSAIARASEETRSAITGCERALLVGESRFGIVVFQLAEILLGRGKFCSSKGRDIDGVKEVLRMRGR